MSALARPEGWTEVPLSRLLVSMESGSRPRGGVRGISSGVPSIGGEHLNSEGGFNFEAVRYVPSEFHDSMRRGHIERGDVLVVKDGATTGKVALVRDDFPFDRAVVNEHVFVCRPDSVDAEYLFWFLHSAEGQRRILDHFKGSAQGGITQDFAAGTLIPVPPRLAQRAIADLISATNSRRLRIAQHFAVASRALARFRLAALAAAYAEANGSDDQETAIPLEELLREPLKNGYSARPVKQETPFRVLTLTATTSGWFDAGQFKYTDEKFTADSTFWLKPGDILIQRGNTAEYVGVPALYEGPPNELLYPDLMIRARPRREIAPRFVWYMLLAPQARNYLRERATGSAGNMPKINQDVLGQTPVPLPSEAIREQIVTRLDRAMALAGAIEQRLGTAGRRVDQSSQAISAKVFGGELSLNRSEDANTSQSQEVGSA